MNPAAIALSEHYDYATTLRAWNGKDYMVAVAAADNRTSPVGFGFQYQRLNQEPDLISGLLPGWKLVDKDDEYRRRYDNLSLSLAYGWFEDRFSIGVKGTLGILHHDSITDEFAGNVTLGIGGRPLPWLAIAVSGRNLLPIQGMVDFNEYGLLSGIWLGDPNVGQFSLDVDWQITGADGMPVSVRLGGEKMIKMFHIGLGFRYEGPLDQQYMSFGIGVFKNAGFNYTFELPLHEKITWNGTIHSFTLRISPPEKSDGR
jgi:hypothetical protein